MKTEKIEILDHGYLKFIEAWGSDVRVIEAARMSTDKGFLGWERETRWRCADCNYVLVNRQDPKLGAGVLTCPNVSAHTTRYLVYEEEGSHAGDARLLKYLYTHEHKTPFEFAGMIIEVQAPIMVFREWQRHRTQSYNELSARYTPLPDVNYVPTSERLLLPGGNNKQAIGLDGKVLDEYNASVWAQELEDLYVEAQRVYRLGLDLGVPKELARLPVPVGRYSRMRAQATLRNWLAFLTLRMDPAAQWEIRQFANAVGDLIAERFPRTWSLFNVTGPVITNTPKQETSS